jgi:hypothetical protein
MPLTQIPSGMIAPAQTLTLNGITFPATQVPSADANTLDDYEEGTWTPTLVPATGTITSSIVVGAYVKIGRQVTCVWNARITGGTITAISGLSGFPFIFSSQVNTVSASSREWFVTGTTWQVNGQVSDTFASFNRYDNSSVAANNYAWAGTITYITD